MPVPLRCSACQTRISASGRCPQCGDKNTGANKLPPHYLIAGAGLALMLCIGAVVVAKSFGDGKPREEQNPPEEKPGTPVAIYNPGDTLDKPLIPPLDLTPPPPKELPAALPPKKPAIAVPPADPLPGKKLIVKRRQNADAEGLRKQLLASPELHIGADTSQKLVAMATVLKAQNRPFQGPTELTAGRTDLAGLPMRMGADCHLGKEPAENLQVLSRKLRLLLELSVPKDDTRPDPEVLRILLLDGKQVEGRRKHWLTPAAVPTLMQLLQAENTPVRTVLVEVLSKIEGKEATEAIANRALMDLSPEVRELAVAELKRRPSEEYVSHLLEGLRYPWPAVADHAAETLAALKTVEAVGPMVKMLGENDPALPVTIGSGPAAFKAVREVVRINHLGNCVLCHAPSAAREDLVRGALPTPGQALPAPSTTPQYYERGSIFVRADITYLRQDFSVVQPVEKHDPWPHYQRYDYMVRNRPVNDAEILQIRFGTIGGRNSPQQESMLFALRELTGKDLGKLAADWAAYVPPDPKKKQPSPELP